MPKEYYYPDTSEPHVHVHKNGMTFTNVGHRHKTLADNQGTRPNAVAEVIQDLQADGSARALDLIQWIRNNT